MLWAFEMGMSLEKVPNAAISNTEGEFTEAEEHPTSVAHTAMPEIPMYYYHRGIVGASFGGTRVLVCA